MKKLLVEAASDEQRYGFCGRLFDEYRAYNLDSSFVYAQRKEELAHRLNKLDYLDDSAMNMAEVMGTTGMYKEALELLGKIDKKTLPNYLYGYYYHLYRTIYGLMGDYAVTEKAKKEYYRMTDLYRDSLLQIPVVRQSVKGIFAAELLNRNFTPVISSHNLRELEDICDHIGLLHKGGILLSQDLEDLKFHVHRLQCVIEDPVAEEELLRQLEILHREKRGSLTTIVARGTREEILERVNTKSPLFAEVLPLSLEEIFISETEAAGYDIKNFMY